MKVCTDSCILGAYAEVTNAQTILDIGTGTGLLALMAAQRTGASITAIEIDKQTAKQAWENINNSPWAERIQVKPVSLQAFALDNQEKYDIMLCNPPFYQQSYKSSDEARNVAMHSEELSFTEILQFSASFLNTTGLLYLLLPPHESRYVAQLAHRLNLFVQEKLSIFTQVGGKHIRTIQSLGFTPAVNPAEKTLCIRQPENMYTSEFTQLLKDYYLIF